MMGYNHLQRFTLLAAFLFAACWAPGALFNQRAYEQATNLKVDALNLVGRGTTTYDSCKQEVDAVKLEFEKAYEYAKGLPNNEETVKQYEIMMNPKGDSFFGFIELWKSDGRLDSVFVSDARDELGRHFDQVIRLESGKRQQ